ncbi:MAG: YggT family protein [Desulfobacterales bacterium]|nr:YggT family protein [Desulfobacterales bacterium]
MFVFGYFLMAIAKILDLVLLCFMWIVVARAVLSWVNPDPFNPIVRFIHNITEPVLYRIRTFLPASFGGIDFSPIIVFLGVIFLRTFVVSSLFRFSSSLL